MEQSVASSQGNISPSNRPRRNWRSIFAGLWPAITARKSMFTSSIRQFIYPVDSDISASMDIEKISARLAIENRAKSDGRNDQPPSTEESISGTQREIVVYFRELQRKARNRVADVAEELRRFGQETNLPGVSGSLRDIPSRCENDVLRLIAESQSQLNILAERETQQQQQYVMELERSQLNQDAERPISPIFRWIFIAALISVVAYAIAKVSVAGFGSTNFMPPLWAISISLIVVLTSSAIARAVSRPANHVEQVRQLTGWLGSGLVRALGIAFIVVMALVAGEYIAAMTTDPEVDLRGIIDSFLTDSLNTAIVVSDWKGFGIVVLAGLMAFLVSYRPDTSRPRHGGTQTGIYRTRKKRDRLTKRLRMQINAIIDEADAKVTEIQKRLKAQMSLYSRLVDESKRIPARLSDYDVALEDGCNILLDRYRVTNTKVRQTEVPLSFSEHICFRPVNKPDFSMFKKEEGRLEELNQGVVELESEGGEVRQKLRDLNSRAIATLEETPSPI